jgi:hypothetical protein
MKFAVRSGMGWSGSTVGNSLPISDGREYVLDHPGLRINPVDHATRRHGEPKLAVLRLDSMSACTWRGRAGLPGTAPPRPSEGPPAEDPPCVTDSDFLSVR